MLVYAHGNCDVCRQNLYPEILQYVTCTCDNCKREYLLCTSCQKLGCPKCGEPIVSDGKKYNKKGFTF